MNTLKSLREISGTLKKWIFALSLCLMLPYSIFAQPIVCDLQAMSQFPPSPYNNAYLKFDGRGDYLKTNDINTLEFDTMTTSSFVIETKFKVEKIYSPQYILGKSFAKGWMLGYHTFQYGYVSMSFGTFTKNIYLLGADTSWHEYRIVYDKPSRTLNSYVDGILSCTYTDFYYGDLQSGSAFSVGNVGFYPNYGPGSINLLNYWFRGSVDFIKIKVNTLPVINYDFNECAGQFAKDSASFFLDDRTLPGQSSCGAVHLMLGYNPCEDTCDPQWISEEVENGTEFYNIGTGLRTIDNSGNYELSFSSGMTSWNNNLVACGKFNRAGTSAVNNIAMWNGYNWSSIGNGFNYELNDVKEFNGDLYATGFFDTAIGFGNTKYIAKWNGSAWEPLSIGLGNIGNVMEVYNNELIVGGFFISAGETYSPSIARWDGTEWHSMGHGMSGPVYAICEYRGELYAGGNFVFAGGNYAFGIAKWNGTQWVSVGNGTFGGEKTVRTMAVYNDELYAAGSFTKMNGVECMNIARYNGERWTDLDGGLKGLGCGSSQGYVLSIEVFNNSLFAAGYFTSAGHIMANKFAKWDGSSWCSVEYGIDLLPRSLEKINNALFISGDFISISGKNYNNIAKYEPKSFTGSSGNNTSAPDKFELKQNYPNPFNPQTKITYTVKTNQSHVKLIVHDLIGQQVAELVNTTQNYGNYEVSFSGQGLASGVYLYSMYVGGSLVDTRKMLLVK